jgi:hypothetical protein
MERFTYVWKLIEDRWDIEPFLQSSDWKNRGGMDYYDMGWIKKALAVLSLVSIVYLVA